MSVLVPEDAGLSAAPFTIEDADRPIIDAHHHLWLQSASQLRLFDSAESEMLRALAPIYVNNPVYLFNEFNRDAKSGHNVVASVFVESGLMHRADGPEHLRSVGEVEFVNGLAAMWASGDFGSARMCAGIVGRADLSLGDRVEELLLALVAAGPDRFRGVRWHVCHDEDPQISPSGLSHPGVLLSENFRAGFSRLARFSLSFEAYVFEPQLLELLDLAVAFPETSIVLDHVGGPLGIGRYRGLREERFQIWRNSIRRLAQCPNVTVKLGGLGMPHSGFGFDRRPGAATAAELALAWKPYVETCIEAFGVHRCMFGSNFPVDSASCSYATLWNAFKLIVASFTSHEKDALFSETAARVYRLPGRFIGKSWPDAPPL